MLSAIINSSFEKKWVDIEKASIMIIVPHDIDKVKIRDFITDGRKVHVMNGDERTKLYNGFIRVISIWEKNNSYTIDIETVNGSTTIRTIFLLKEENNRYKIEGDKVILESVSIN